MSDRLGVLFLGCGLAARMHSRTLKKIGGVELDFASRDGTRAEEFRKRFGGRRAFGSYEDAVTADGVDVVCVLTPTASHQALALLALAAGRHVVVEKPAFMRSGDAAPVREAAARAGRLVMVAENYYYKPLTRHIRRLVGAGRFGAVRFVSVNATKRQKVEGWREQPAMSGGGALFEGGVHWINFMASIGLDVLDVQAWRVGTGGAADMDVSTLSVFSYANGAVGTLAHSWELPAPFGGLRLSKIQGTTGALTFESNGLGYRGTGTARSLGAPAVGGDFLGYRAMFEDFLRAVRTNTAPEFTFDLAVRDLDLLERAEASMNSR